MSKVNKATDAINDTSKKITNGVKNFAFDFIAIGIIIAMLVISLGAIEMKTITKKSILDMIVDVIPFYLANIVLSINYYQKGVYSGKASEQFIGTVKVYSNIVNALDGMHHKLLKKFCTVYNENALREMQKAVLERYSITYDEFMIGNSEHKPFVQMSGREIKHRYGKEVYKAVKAAKNVSVKGINVNILLSSYYKSDVTDLGLNESQLMKRRTSRYTIVGLLSIVSMTLITAKNIMTWGWMGAMIALFKLLWIVSRACMRYYEGYSDITTKFANHISRKSDILKEFNSWYEDNSEESEKQTEMQF